MTVKQRGRGSDNGRHTAQQLKSIQYAYTSAQSLEQL